MLFRFLNIQYFREARWPILKHILYIKFNFPPPKVGGGACVVSISTVNEQEHLTCIQKSFGSTHLEQACHFNFNIFKLDNYLQIFVKPFLNI
jgi:hypothetical protein